MDSRPPFALLDPLPKLRNLGFIFAPLRLEIVPFLLRLDQLCFGVRNLRSRLAEPGVGGGHGRFAPLQLVFSCDPKPVRRHFARLRSQLSGCAIRASFAYSAGPTLPKARARKRKRRRVSWECSLHGGTTNRWTVFLFNRRWHGNPIREARADFRGAAALFALHRPGFRPIERVMGQQHRVRVKRRRRIAYLDRKKAAAKAVPVRREAPKSKPKAKKQVAPAPTPET